MDTVFNHSLCQPSVIITFLRLLQALFLCQTRVADTEREDNQRYGQTDTRDTQQFLRMFVGQYDGVAVRRADGVCFGEGEWIGVDLSGQCRVAKPIQQLAGQNLSPDGAGYGVSDGAADVVRGEEDAGDDGKVCVG